VTRAPLPSRRLEFLDQLRALAILFVLVSHFGLAIDGDFGAFENRTINFGSIGVFIFFCVSGYVIPWSMRGQRAGEFVSTRSFWIRRVLRLYPMYPCAAAVGMLWLKYACDKGRSYAGLCCGSARVSGHVRNDDHALARRTGGVRWP
jgi:peptidoglycan/LPS O-acetylase OafA/YrhL